MKRALLIAVLIAGMSVPGWGQTVTGITGTIGDGNSVTVTGSSFGTKPTAAPTKHDDFEGGTNGNDLTGWDLRDTAPTYSNAVLRTGSTMSARANFEGSVIGSSFGYEGTWSTSEDEVYLDTWYYYAAATPPSRNHKMFRLHTDGVGSPNLAYTMFCSDDPALLTQDGVTTGTWSRWTSGFATGYLRDKWSHVQLYVKQSSAGGTDGIAKFWIDGNLIVDEPSWTTRESGDNRWNTILIGQYMSHSATQDCAASGDGYTYWDDTYVDTSRARVEIGNNAVYASATHREIQIPSAWSDTSITITLNQGSFTGFNQQYLYVIDSNGNASAGFEITEGTPPPPTPELIDRVRLRVEAMPGGQLIWDLYQGAAEWFEVATDGAEFLNWGAVSTIPLPVIAGLYLYAIRPCNQGGCAEATEVEVDVLPNPPPPIAPDDFEVR